MILVLVDDFADHGDKAMHSSTNILTSLFLRASFGLRLFVVGPRTACRDLDMPYSFLLDVDVAAAKFEIRVDHLGRARRSLGPHII